MIAAPSPPDGPPDAHRYAQDFVARDDPCGIGFLGLGVLAREDNCGGTARGDGIVALAGVEGAIGCDARDPLLGQDLVEQLGQYRRITHVAGGGLSNPDFQGFIIDPEVDLTPDPAFGAAMFAPLPLAPSLDLTSRAVDQKVQRALRTPVRDVDLQGPLAP